MQYQIGINADCIAGDYCAILRKIKELGFSSFFMSAELENISQYKRLADELGLNFEFLHAEWEGINAMWQEGEECVFIYEKMRKAIDLCAENDIPAVIIHTSSGWCPPAAGALGFSRFDSLVNYAKEKGVIIAFENLRGVDTLRYITGRYKDFDNVRYCYDVGHANCYTPYVDWIGMFGEKLMYTHIHDNLLFPGYDRDGDSHFLPFDGKIDYRDELRRLAKVGYKGSLMLECFKEVKEEYQKMTMEEFLTLAKERVQKLVEIIQEF